MKIDIWVICTLDQLSVLTLKLSYSKDIVIREKPLFCVLCTPHFVVLTLAFHRAVFYENITFSIIVLSTKRRYSSFLFFVFQKTFFKVKALNIFKASTDCQIKKCWSLKQRAVLKILFMFFSETMFFLVLKWSFYEEVSPGVKTKTNEHFPVKFQKAVISYFLSIWLNHLVKCYSGWDYSGLSKD